jgi:HEPN domain-containing protein
MQPDDPTRAAEAREWLRKVVLDLRAAALDLNTEPPLLEDTLFHAQQAAEKSMKAFLAWYDEPFRKTHDLRVLGQQCVQLDDVLEPVLRKAARLTQYAWKYRYPGNVEPPSMEEARQALELATEVAEAIQSRLPEDVHL